MIHLFLKGFLIFGPKLVNKAEVAKSFGRIIVVWFILCLSLLLFHKQAKEICKKVWRFMRFVVNLQLQNA